MGVLPVVHLVKKILNVMAVNYCGHRLARRFGWAATAYHKKEGATLHHGACMFSLQYDGRCGGRFECWFERGNLGEVCEELRKDD